MDATHIHLILNHFPIVGTIIGVGILAYGIFKNNDAIKKVALTVLAIMAIIAVPVYLTGEEAEETVEHFKGITKEVIHEHEELAEKAILLMALLGALSLASIYAITKGLSFAKKITIITFIISILTFGLFAKVGNLGGQIRHSEIRNQTTNTPLINTHDNDD